MSTTDHELSVYAVNLRRLMARKGLTLAEVVSATGACERTVKGILSGRTKPHARTLNRIAAGLNVSAGEFFQQPVERRMWGKQLTESEVRKKVERLLASDQRELLIGMVDMLSLSATEPTNTHSDARTTDGANNSQRHSDDRRCFDCATPRSTRILCDSRSVPSTRR
jgi:transcriptional regulator with XRE-family HTH domain